MKNMSFIVATILSAIFLNCEKSPPLSTPPDVTVIPPIIEFGKGSVLKNGVAWDVPFNAWYYRSDSSFQIRAKILYANLVQESFFMRDIPCAIGRYPLQYFPSAANLISDNIPESAFAMTYEFDQPVGDFFIDTTRTDHYVEVLEYDSMKHTVQGWFQVFLGKKPINVPFPGIPDSIFLTEGKFNLRIQEP